MFSMLVRNTPVGAVLPQPARVSEIWMSVDQMYLTESECKMVVDPFINERSSSRKTATSAAQGSDEFEIEPPISSQSFIVAQAWVWSRSIPLNL